MKNRVVLIVAVADRVHTTKSRFKEIIFAYNVQYKPLWWFLNAVKFNLCSDSFEITSPVAILGNNDVSWRLVVCVIKFKGEQFITIVRMCVCMESSALLSAGHLIRSL